MAENIEKGQIRQTIIGHVKDSDLFSRTMGSQKSLKSFTKSEMTRIILLKMKI